MAGSTQCYLDNSADGLPPFTKQNSAVPTGKGRYFHIRLVLWDQLPMKGNQSIPINDYNGVMASHLDVDPQVCTVVVDVGDTKIGIMATNTAFNPHGVDTAMCTLAVEAAKYAVAEKEKR